MELECSVFTDLVCNELGICPIVCHPKTRKERGKAYVTAQRIFEQEAERAGFSVDWENRLLVAIE